MGLKELFFLSEILNEEREARQRLETEIERLRRKVEDLGNEPGSPDIRLHETLGSGAQGSKEKGRWSRGEKLGFLGALLGLLGAIIGLVLFPLNMVDSARDEASEAKKALIQIQADLDGLHKKCIDTPNEVHSFKIFLNELLRYVELQDHEREILHGLLERWAGAPVPPPNVDPYMRGGPNTPGTEQASTGKDVPKSMGDDTQKSQALRKSGEKFE